MTAEPSDTASWWQRRNWWKIGFFVLLALFEITREWGVIASDAKPVTGVMQGVYQFGDIIHAEGRWRRIDGGRSLLPNISSIDCNRSQGECTETSVLVWDNTVGAPTSSTYPAEFTKRGASYTNDLACVRYDVNIDVNAKQVTSVRQLKPNSEQTDAQGCGGIEKRLETVLSDGYGSRFGDFDLPTDSFLPLYRTLRWVFGNK